MILISWKSGHNFSKIKVNLWNKIFIKSFFFIHKNFIIFTLVSLEKISGSVIISTNQNLLYIYFTFHIKYPDVKKKKKKSISRSPTNSTQQISAILYYSFTPNNPTFDPPTKEEPSPARRRTEHLGNATSQLPHKIQVHFQTLGLLNH